MKSVRSFDLFDTLVAAPEFNRLAGDVDSHFPILENILQVQPDDIVVSDYYDSEKATRILRNVCGLKNKLYVTMDGKRDGSIWPKLKSQYHITSHTGDNGITDRDSALAAGITPIHFLGSSPTPTESYLYNQGLKGLAQCIREARLTLFNKEYREVEYLQTQVNFPFLFVASILLHHKVVLNSDVLMSSRDCCLWVKLQDRVRQLLGGTYRVHYFLSSRISRAKASSTYVNYVESLMGTNPAVVDVCGYGRTLPSLLKRTKFPNTSVILAIKYPDPENPIPPTNLNWLIQGNAFIERANLAKHPMVSDVMEDGTPVYSNPAHIEWDAIPQIDVSHKTFIHALNLMGKYDFTGDLNLNPEGLTNVLSHLLSLYSQHTSALLFDNDSILTKEESPVLLELEKLKRKDNGESTPQITVRLHCEMPYFGQIAPNDTMNASTLGVAKNVECASVSSNSEKMANDFEVVLGKPCYFLPSCYSMPPVHVRHLKGDTGVDHVACFGRIFNLKNVLIQAVAALRFARKRGNKLHFHVNNLPDSWDGKANMEVLNNFFQIQPDARLVAHGWMSHPDFLNLLSTMTIGLQVSMTEASNVLTLDMMAAGLPMVVSKEIKWADPRCVAHHTDSVEICEQMLYAMENSEEIMNSNLNNIDAYNHECIKHWRNFLNHPKPKVLFLVHDAGINTGISTVTSKDANLLIDNEIDTHVVRSKFTVEEVKKCIAELNPTHIISEASWRPLEYFLPKVLQKPSTTPPFPVPTAASPMQKPPLEWKKDFLKNKVEALFQKFRYVVATVPNSAHYKQLCKIYPEHFEEIVDTPEGRRIIFVVDK